MKAAWKFEFVGRCGIIVMLSALSGATISADEPSSTKPIRVLFVGNSQVYYNNLHKIVEALAESTPPDRPRIQTDAKPSDRSVAGGATLKSHWNRGTGKDTARAKIAEERWDFVILQDNSSVTSVEEFTEYAGLFHELIRANNGKTVFLCTAHFPHLVPKGFLEVNERHVTLAKQWKVPVAAAGKAWLAYWGDNPTQEQILDLYDPDKGHPGKKGSYLYACTLYAILMGQSPVGLTHRIHNEPETTITPAEAKRFQEAAWRVHQEVNGDAAKPTVIQRWSVLPNEVRLSDLRSRTQLLATAEEQEGYQVDVTREVTFESTDLTVAVVDQAGVVRPKGAGSARVRVRGFDREVEIPVVVDDLSKAPPVSFTNEVMAVLSKRGCNAGACHGHNSGKGSFKLSLRGSNPSADHKAILDFADLDQPDQSWLLRKPTVQEPHRGGQRFAVGSESHLILRQWLAEGAKADVGSAAAIKHIEVLPESRFMSRTGLAQQLVVKAHFADGTIRDVTDQAIFDLSAEGVIEVSADGLVTGNREGEAAVLVRFLGNLGLSRYVVIQQHPNFAWTESPANNFVDQHVHNKLRMIQVYPSELCSDSEFLRRVSLDVTGLPPTADEVRAFVSDQRPDKRSRKIDELLERDEFGDVWAAHWLELSGTDQGGDSAGAKGVWTLSFWLRDAINRNLPYDQFVTALVSAKGSSLTNPAITFGVNRLPKVEVIPQLFLGMRLECAQCHDHPFDVWKQSDYNSLREFFTAIKSKEGPGDPGGREIRVFVPPEKLLFGERDKKVSLRLLDGQVVEVSEYRDRREVLADWLFGSAKMLTARAIANRVWGKLLGRGIVDPVDDMRFSNPPVNEPLLQALAEDFVVHGFDFKHLVRTMLNSRTYQLSSVPNATNEREVMNFSHARLRRLSAEQLLDALSRVTGVDEAFPVGPPGGRAMQIPLSYTGSRFLTMFGRPQQRMSPCECIRSHETTLPQVLHLLNGDTIGQRLRADGGTLRRLLDGQHDDDRLVEELYLTVLNRLPSEREGTIGREAVRESENRQDGAEDLMWALLTSQEFLFNH